jgi:hypothetical protein
MPQFVVFAIDRDEDEWETRDEESRQATYDADYAMGQLLEKRGGRVVGGADLTHSRDARVLSRGTDGVLVTEGPYAESVEQLSGFYIVEADSVEDVVEAAKLMLEGHHRLEIRPRPVREEQP